MLNHIISWCNRCNGSWILCSKSKRVFLLVKKRLFYFWLLAGKNLFQTVYMTKLAGNNKWITGFFTKNLLYVIRYSWLSQEVVNWRWWGQAFLNLKVFEFWYGWKCISYLSLDNQKKVFCFIKYLILVAALVKIERKVRRN